MAVPAQSGLSFSGDAIQDIDGFAAQLGQLLSSIQAIAYYVEMNLPLGEWTSLQYLLKVQVLVEECNGVLQELSRSCRALRSDAEAVGPDDAKENSNIFDPGGSRI